MADIIRSQGDYSFSASGGRDKFNFKTISVVNLDNCAKISDPKVSRRHVSFEDNGIENLEHNSPRHCGNESG